VQYSEDIDKKQTFKTYFLPSKADKTYALLLLYVDCRIIMSSDLVARLCAPQWGQNYFDFAFEIV
jgi:hypothetical protein